MQKRTLIVLTTLVALLLTWVLLVEVGGQKKREEKEELESQVFALREGQVRKVTLKGAAGPVTLEKVAAQEGSEGDWRLKEPRELAADPQAADALAEAIRALKSTRKVPPTAATPADFGFDDDAFRVSFEADGYEGARSFRLGKTAPIGDARYLSVDGETDIRLVPAWQASALEKTAGDLRDKRLATFSESAVQKVSLRGGEVAVELLRQGDGFVLEGTPRLRADRGAVQSLLADLSGLRALEFPEGVDAASGLDTPAFTATVDLGAQGGTLELRFGATTDKGTYARRGADGEVAIVASYVLDGIKKGRAAWRSTSVVDLNSWMCTSVAGTWRGKPFDASKGEAEEWKFSYGGAKPEALPTPRATDLLRELTELRGQDGTPVPAAAAPLGKLVVTQSNGPKVAFELRQAGGDCSAAVDGDPAPMALAGCGVVEFLDRFTKDPAGKAQSDAETAPAGETQGAH